jgi:hypothetical protein
LAPIRVARANAEGVAIGAPIEVRAPALIIPNKPVTIVNRGAVLWGLFPRSFIVARCVEGVWGWGWGVGWGGGCVGWGGGGGEPWGKHH